MILDLRGYDSFPVKVRLSSDPDDKTRFCTDQMLVEELTLDLNISESAGQYYCTGTMTAGGKIECARCLTRYQTEIEYETGFIIREHNVDDSNKSDDALDDEEYITFRGGELIADVSDQARQAVMLAEPMHPLCSEDCKGLCSSCGANLNEGDCGCRRDRVDSRWDGLNALKDLR